MDSPPNEPDAGIDSPDRTQDLISRYRSGDLRALEVLIERHLPRIERIVRVRVGRRLLAESSLADLVQSVLVRVVSGIDGYHAQDDARWIDWVARLAENEIRNLARRDRAGKRGGGAIRTESIDATFSSGHEVAADTSSIGGKVARREEMEIVDRYVQGLPGPQREVILLRDYMGADWRTIAERMGRPSPEACQELHRRARAELLRRVHGRL